jgi:hypothetical protein
MTLLRRTSTLQPPTLNNGGRQVTGGFQLPELIFDPPRDVVGGSEPPTGSTVVPGILDQDIFGTGITGQDLINIGQQLFGGGGNGNGQTLTGGGLGPCPGIGVVRDPITGNCVDLTALPPGGDPAIIGPTPQVSPTQGFGPAVNGRFGVGLVPRVDVQTVRRCPAGMALGKDGVCYDGLGRNSPKRQWPMGMKPLLTPGERRAIRVAASAANKLKRSKKSLMKASRALEKAC